MTQPDPRGAPSPGDAPPPDATAEASGDSGLAASKKEFIQTFFKRAEEFTETLLRDNERLRYRIVELEERLRAHEGGGAALGGGATASDSVRVLADRVAALEAEREHLTSRFQAVEGESQHFEDRYREIERENNNLANLYVASYQLHSTLDLREVTRIILEILLNFVGARTFAVLLLDERQHVLRPLAAEGIARDRVPLVRVDEAGEGIAEGAVAPRGSGRSIARAVRSGQQLVAATAPRGTLDLEAPLIVTPLRFQQKVVGAIVVWEFLQQKTELADVDHELFDLLAVHAASALHCARLAHEMQHQGEGAPALWAVVDLV